jgi:hypothetical protein
LEQLNIKTMPKSEDVYARLIDSLRNEGYSVRLYDSKTEVPGDEDVLIYIQPWVMAPAIREALARRLADGGNIIIAAQHYRMQARKYPGHAYSLVYWPQPQFSRINEFLEPYGVELVSEVFLDQSKAPMASREQINWGAYRKEEKRAPDAQPFLIRAVPENFSKESPVTARLSDLLFIWGNRWRKSAGTFSGRVGMATSGIFLQRRLERGLERWIFIPGLFTRRRLFRRLPTAGRGTDGTISIGKGPCSGPSPGPRFSGSAASGAGSSATSLPRGEGKPKPGERL